MKLESDNMGQADKKVVVLSGDELYEMSAEQLLDRMSEEEPEDIDLLDRVQTSIDKDEGKCPEPEKPQQTETDSKEQTACESEPIAEEISVPQAEAETEVAVGMQEEPDQASQENAQQKSILSGSRKKYLRIIAASVAFIVLSFAAVYSAAAIRLSGVAYASEATDTDELVGRYYDEFYAKTRTYEAQSESETKPEELPTLILPDEEENKLPEVLNIILLGTDERSKLFRDSNTRSDSMILCSVNRKTDKVSLISFERNLYVEYAGKEHKGKKDMIGFCFRYGGVDLFEKTVKKNFNVTIDRYIRVNFSSFIDIINTLGGVSVELTQKEAEYINTQKLVHCRKVRKGKQVLDGAQTLIYCRTRKIDSDKHRVKRQRNVLQQLATKVSDLSPTELYDLASMVLPMVDTDLSTGEIISLCLDAPDLLKNEFNQMSVPISTSCEDKHVDLKANAKAIAEMIY